MSEIRVNKVIDEAGTGSVELTQGATLPSGKTLSGAGDLNLTGIVTAASGSFTGNISVGGTITYDDVTNIDSVGIVTAGKGFRATTGGIIVTAGVSTLAATTATSTIIAGITTIDASGVNVTGVVTATSFSGPGNIPGPSQSGTVTLAATDAGKFVSAGSGGVTVAASILAAGEGITIYNSHSGDITLTCSAPTAVYLGTDGSTKTSITLATRCICTFFCVDASSNGTYVCIGGGIS